MRSREIRRSNQESPKRDGDAAKLIDVDGEEVVIQNADGFDYSLGCPLRKESNRSPLAGCFLKAHPI
jgi:hypothetical protein